MSLNVTNKTLSTNNMTTNNMTSSLEFGAGTFEIQPVQFRGLVPQPRPKSHFLPVKTPNPIQPSNSNQSTPITSTQSTPRSINSSLSTPSTQPNFNTTGGYAVTTSKTMSWLKTPVKQEKSKGRKPKTQTTQMYPFFSECAELETDPYWKSILTSCSIGKFPKGFTFRNMYLTMRKGTKTERILLPESSQDAVKIIINFFKNQTGMRSNIDTVRERKELTEEFTDDNPLEERRWSTFPKKVQNNMIDGFINIMSKTMSLTPLQKKKLTTLINVGFIVGYFTSDHVTIVEGRITRISGLAYNPEAKEFIFDTTKVNLKPTSKSKNKVIPEHVYLDPSYKPYYDRPVYISFLNIWLSYLNMMIRTAPKKTTKGDVGVGGVGPDPTQNSGTKTVRTTRSRTTRSKTGSGLLAHDPNSNGGLISTLSALSMMTESMEFSQSQSIEDTLEDTVEESVEF